MCVYIYIYIYIYIKFPYQIPKKYYKIKTL